MNAVGLHQAVVQGHAVEKERIEENAVAGGQRGKDGPKRIASLAMMHCTLRCLFFVRRAKTNFGRHAIVLDHRADPPEGIGD
jgi:hypothetical protein